MNLLEKIKAWLVTFGRIRAASELARLGENKAAKNLMKEIS